MSRTKLLGNVATVRQALVRCILLYRRPAGRMDEAIAQVAASAGIDRGRVRALYYDQINVEMTDEERHHAVLGVCAARMWLAGWLGAVKDEIEAETALIEGAENQRYVREWVDAECARQNASSGGRAA